jgi:hypothetical protein
LNLNHDIIAFSDKKCPVLEVIFRVCIGTYRRCIIWFGFWILPEFVSRKAVSNYSRLEKKLMALEKQIRDIQERSK